MWSKWPKLASLAQKNCTRYIFSSLVCSLLLNDNLLKNIFEHKIKQIEYIQCLIILAFKGDASFMLLIYIVS